MVTITTDEYQSLNVLAAIGIIFLIVLLILLVSVILGSIIAYIIESIHDKKGTRHALKIRSISKVVDIINDALNIKLEDWQIEYIFNKKDISISEISNRRNGKTLTHILRILFNTKYINSVDICSDNYVSICRNDFDFSKAEYFDYTDNTQKNKEYFNWYNEYFMDTYKKLKNAGLSKYMIEVKFHKLNNKENR